MLQSAVDFSCAAFLSSHGNQNRAGAAIFSASVIGLALALTVVAIIGKAGLRFGSVLEKGLDRLSIGLGMVPRGEVGLIFAGLGLTLKIQESGF